MSDIIIPELTSFEWVKTCEACPVQFDLYDSKGIKVAYFRFRGGILSVNNYNGEEIGDDVIYLDEHTYNGSYLSQKELDKILETIEQIQDKKIELAMDWSGVNELEAGLKKASEFTQLVKNDAKQVGDTYQMTAAQAREWLEFYPELGEIAEVTTDGLIAMDIDKVNTF
jgi:hypothetical protein